MKATGEVIIHFNKSDQQDADRVPLTADTDLILRDIFQVNHAFPVVFSPEPKRPGLWARVWSRMFGRKEAQHGSTKVR